MPTSAKTAGSAGGAGPYVTGAAHPGWRAPLGTPEVREQAPSQRVCQGSLANSQGASQTPGASRRSITSLRRGRGKGEGRTRRPKTKNTGGGALAFSFLVARMSLKRVYARLQRAM